MTWEVDLFWFSSQILICESFENCDLLPFGKQKKSKQNISNVLRNGAEQKQIIFLWPKFTG